MLEKRSQNGSADAVCVADGVHEPETTPLEPALPRQVVIDRESVANRPLGASAWSRVEGREYNYLGGDDTYEESDRKRPADAERLQ